MDNLAGAQRSTLSTPKSGTPVVSKGHLRGKRTEETQRDSSLTNLLESTLTPLSGCPKDGVHLSRRVGLSSRALVISGQGDRQIPTDRLNPLLIAIRIDEVHHYLGVELRLSE